MHSRVRTRWLLVGAGIVAVCLSSAACSAPPATFDVDGKLASNADEVRDTGTCVFGDVRYHDGDEVVLRGADDILLAVDHLHKGNNFHPGQHGTCDMTFRFHDVRPGDVGYQLTVGSSRRIVLSEDQLRAPDFQVVPRGHNNDDAPDFQVGAPTSSQEPKP